MPPLVSELVVDGFRSVRHSRLTLGPLCALVGEPETGKSNLLAALRAVLDPTVTPEPGDRLRGGGEIGLEATLPRGGRVRLDGLPPDMVRSTGAAPPPVLHLPAAARAHGLVAAAASPAAAIFRGLAADAAPAQPAIIAALDACREAEIAGVLLLVEEPELYLGPQRQRYLYRALRRFVEAGNQVVYSTHAATFLNAARLDEVVFVERLESTGTRVARPAPLTAETDFRVLSEFDAERSELLLARAALLVEGLTEKLAFPFVFAALGFDADREGITIVECGGKANIPLFARVCAAAGVPCVAVHDRDARPGRRPRLSERVNNALVREAAGAERTIVVEPDFEGLAHLPGGARKPEQAWHRFASLGAAQMPEPLTRAARLSIELARGGTQRR
jgi:putative ATP-dependent endonuclease of the OLD family